MTNGTGSGGIFLAFLGGALVGTAAAMLLVPRSGAATRARLGDAMADAGDQLRRTPHAAAAAVDAAKEAFTGGMAHGDGMHHGP